MAKKVHLRDPVRTIIIIISLNFTRWLGYEGRMSTMGMTRHEQHKGGVKNKICSECSETHFSIAIFEI